ncbi:hypothetical protein GCM10009087_21840 [Sphingomonas oligophenolica]|uniref:Uncharacterized protein n=1 Tax=Sphingomonas oligophenolica TaxID=301154 RepID=A0ABU9Y3K2_9SPHN
MIRRFAIAAALSTASLVVFLPAASAQTYGGVTLSFGSPGYHDRYDRRYEQPRYNPYEDQDEAWEARRRWEQHERWERERARQEHWRHEHAEHGRWHRDDDDDD